MCVGYAIFIIVNFIEKIKINRDEVMFMEEDEKKEETTEETTESTEEKAE